MGGAGTSANAFGQGRHAINHKRAWRPTKRDHERLQLKHSESMGIAKTPKSPFLLDLWNTTVSGTVILFPVNLYPFSICLLFKFSLSEASVNAQPLFRVMTSHNFILLPTVLRDEYGIVWTNIYSVP